MKKKKSCHKGHKSKCTVHTLLKKTNEKTTVFVFVEVVYLFSFALLVLWLGNLLSRQEVPHSGTVKLIPKRVQQRVEDGVCLRQNRKHLWEESGIRLSSLCGIRVDDDRTFTDHPDFWRDDPDVCEGGGDTNDNVRAPAEQHRLQRETSVEL